MASRGDVLVSVRKLGFTLGEDGKEEEFLVLQSDTLNGILPTVVVAPLIHDDADYAKQPLAAKVRRADGSTGLVLVWLLAALPLSRFKEAPTGRLPLAEMGRVNRVARTVLDLP